MTVHLERLTDAGAQELPGGITLRLARGNPAAVLLTSRARRSRPGALPAAR